MIIGPACEKYTLPRQGIVNPIYLALLGSMFSMDLLDYFPWFLQKAFYVQW